MELPKKIYHYTSADGLHGILSSGILYFTDSLFLNDRHERKNLYLVLEKHLRKFDLEKGFREALENRYFGDNDYISRNLRAVSPADAKTSRYFVLSCSENSDSLPMWNYYTRSKYAAGYNLHLDTQELLRQLMQHPVVRDLNTGKLGQRSMLHGRIIYDEALKIRQLWALLEQTCREWSQRTSPGQKESVLKQLDRSFEETSLFYKDSAFSHEREARMVIASDNGHVHRLGAPAYLFRKVRGVQVPYLAVDVLEKSRAISGVTAGPALDKEMAVNGVEYMLFYYGFPQTCKVSAVPLRY